MRTLFRLLCSSLAALALIALNVGCTSTPPQHHQQAARSSADPRFQQVQEENEIHGEVGAYYGHAGR